MGDFLTTNAGSSAGLCESSFLQYTLQSRTRVGPIGIVGYNSTCIRFFFGIFFSNLEKINLKNVVGSFFSKFGNNGKLSKKFQKSIFGNFKNKIAKFGKIKKLTRISKFGKKKT